MADASSTVSGALRLLARSSSDLTNQLRIGTNAFDGTDLPSPPDGASQKVAQLHFAENRKINHEILRAVPHASVLSDHGKHLRNSDGDEHTYNLSHPTESFDAFLSHSWQEPGWLKYLALCYHFNKRVALIACAVASLSVVLLHAVRGQALLPLSMMPSMCSADPPRRKGLDASIAGFSALMVGLLYGHRLPFVRPQQLFLDKICIHQTDPVLKQAGIRALDQFLHSSRSMVVLCSDSYLTRLWCVYELAAYTAFDLARDGSNLVFLPLAKVPSMLLMCAALWGWPAAEYFGQLLNGGGTRDSDAYLADTVAPVPIAPVVLPALFGFIGWSALAAGRQRQHLLTDLRHFSVHRAQCHLESDRNFVLGPSPDWYADDPPSMRSDASLASPPAQGDSRPEPAAATGGEAASRPGSRRRSEQRSGGGDRRSQMRRHRHRTVTSAFGASRSSYTRAASIVRWNALCFATAAASRWRTDLLSSCRCC